MKDKLALFYKILIVIVSGFGIVLNIMAFSLKDTVIYYTIQSNILCFIFFLIVVILSLTKKLKKGNVYYIFKGLVTMAITITMFVYQLLLSTNSGFSAYDGYELECSLVHLIVPLLVITDYIFFGEKGNLKKSYPFIWSLSLVFYLLFDIIYVSLGGTFIGGARYPYFYMDINTYGLMGVFINCLVVYTFFIGYGTIVQNLDNKLAKKK